MKDQYVGDVGDYGKLGVLRALTAGGGPSLGVVWYLVPNDGTTDGRFIDYLRPSSALRACDPPLFDALATLVGSGTRKVAELARIGVLPNGTVYYDDLLELGDVPDRAAQRSRWLARALEVTRDCGLVFVDPDNGLETMSTSRTAKRGPKYVFYDELRAFSTRGQGLVIYHHLNRAKGHGTHERQVQQRLADLGRELGISGTIYGLRFRRGSSRVFFVTEPRRGAKQLRARIHAFRASPWADHFEVVEHTPTATSSDR